MKKIAFIVLMCLLLVGCITSRPANTQSRHRQSAEKIYQVKFYDNGMQVWFLNNRIHREDKPAVVHPNGHEEWWYNNQRHRSDGPAVTTASGEKQFWFRGVQYNDMNLWSNAVNARTRNTMHGQTITLDGRTYTLYYNEE